MDSFGCARYAVAISMFTSLGYCLYITVLNYPSGNPEEDAHDMR